MDVQRYEHKIKINQYVFSLDEIEAFCVEHINSMGYKLSPDYSFKLSFDGSYILNDPDSEQS